MDHWDDLDKSEAAAADNDLGLMGEILTRREVRA
jgi:hypothetical protein